MSEMEAENRTAVDTHAIGRRGYFEFIRGVVAII